MKYDKIYTYFVKCGSLERSTMDDFRTTTILNNTNQNTLQKQRVCRICSYIKIS